MIKKFDICKKMQFLHIDENNYTSIKYIKEGEEFNIGKELSCLDESYLSTVYWHENNIKNTREIALKMVKEGKNAKYIREFLEKRTTNPRYGVIQIRGRREAFQVEVIPSQYTGGKHLCVAWKKKKSVSIEKSSAVSAIISLCLGGTQKGKKGKKSGKVQMDIYTYRGEAIIFDDWLLKKEEFKFSMNTRQMTKPTHVTEKDFWGIFQVSQNLFYQQELEKQKLALEIGEGRKYLYKWLDSEDTKDIEEDYRENLKGQLLSVCYNPEWYPIIKAKILKWQEEDKELRQWKKSEGKELRPYWLDNKEKITKMENVKEEKIKPEVVKICRKEGKVIQDCDVYIGRACFRGGWELKQSEFHNPFSVNKFGREKSIELYENYLRQKIEEDETWKEKIRNLEGKKLGCWCKPESCHGDIIIKIFTELF